MSVPKPKNLSPEDCSFAKASRVKPKKCRCPHHRNPRFFEPWVHDTWAKLDTQGRWDFYYQLSGILGSTRKHDMPPAPALSRRWNRGDTRLKAKD